MTSDGLDMLNFGQVVRPTECLPCMHVLTTTPLPRLDMLNFGQVGIRAEFNVAMQGFVATATAPIAQGSELLFYYGTMCQEAWINLYGFAPADARPCRSPNRATGGSSMNKSVNQRARAKKSS